MLSIDLGSIAGAITGSRSAENALNEQRAHNRATNILEADKYRYSQGVYLDQKKREDNRIQRLVNDANKAGVSINTALGAAGSSPITAQIPGHTSKRVGGNANTISPSVVASLQKTSETQKSIENSTALEQQFRADIAYWDAKKRELEYNRSVDGSVYPKKYMLYEDNMKEAQEHIRRGGFVIPAGASMELPESIGAYQFGKPYATEEDFLQRMDERKNPNRYKIGISP